MLAAHRRALFTSPKDPFFGSVQALLNFDGPNAGTSFPDLSIAARTFTANGAAAVDSSIFRFGSGSLNLNGSTSYLSTPSAASLHPGSGNFTFEAWLYLTGGSNDKAIWDCIDWVGTLGQHCFGVDSSSRLFFYFADGSNNTLTSTATVASSIWTHVACERVGSTISFYLNGANAGGGGTCSYNMTPALTRKIGSSLINTGSAQYLAGRIDDLRITIGVARYGGPFQVPRFANPMAF